MTTYCTICILFFQFDHFKMEWKQLTMGGVGSRGVMPGKRRLSKFWTKKCKKGLIILVESNKAVKKKMAYFMAWHFTCCSRSCTCVINYGTGVAWKNTGKLKKHPDLFHCFSQTIKIISECRVSEMESNFSILLSKVESDVKS